MKLRTWLSACALALAVPAAAQVGGEQDLQVAGVEALRQAVEELRANMFRRGRRVEGWDVGGVDPDADLRARGPERFYFLNRDSAGTSVGILTRRPPADFAPAGWRVVDSYGSMTEALPDPQLDFVPFSDRYVVALRSQFHRRRDVNCSTGISGALLYEVPDARSGPGDETVPIMFRLMMLAVEDQEVCVRTDGDGRTGYRSSLFTADGFELPELNDPLGLSYIVPAAPIDQLIEPPPPPPEGRT